MQQDDLKQNPSARAAGNGGVISELQVQGLLRDALRQVRNLKQRLEEQERRHEPIAIIGASCRMPGGVQSLAELWQVLLRGTDAVGLTPSNRWDHEALYDADPSTPGKAYARHGAFLDDVEHFDPEFFGISPLEAGWMDPQQRVLLELAWEALEDAGLIPASLEGSQTGVFMGAMSMDFTLRLMGSLGRDQINAYAGTGSASSALAGRLAYVLGLQGPTLSVDTACSSSLVSVHLACQALRQQECSLALAGGVNLLLSPEPTLNLCKAQMLSRTGRCRTFDAEADGYVRGEGAGLVVLKRLSSAQQDGDRILGVIRASGVGQDGRSSGLTAPNGQAQQELFRSVLNRAKLQPDEVGYLECHGTGTPLGDPIELSSVVGVYGQGRRPQRPLAVGSLKTNFGHMEGAAGIGGLLKALLVVRHRLIPPHLHLKQLNPHIRALKADLHIPTEPTPWFNSVKSNAGESNTGGSNSVKSNTGEVPRAAVSAFGFVGTSSHIILEAPPATAPVSPSSVTTQPTSSEPHGESPSPILFSLTARTPEALQALAGRYAEWLELGHKSDVAGDSPTHEETPHPLSLSVLSSAIHAQRSQLEHRLTLTVSEMQALKTKLMQLSRLPLEEFTQRSALDELSTYAPSELVDDLRGITVGRVPRRAARMAWLFTGQGAQRMGMGQELYQRQPHFRAAVERCDAILRQQGGPSARTLLLESTQAELNQTRWTQPALFVFEYALASMLLQGGLKPYAVAGHSVGEYVAACIAGVLSLEDALRLIDARARLMHALPAGGGMMAALCEEERLTPLLRQEPTLAVAARNNPREVVLSGPRDALERMQQALEAQGVSVAPLRVSHAFHSPLMGPMLEPFRRVLEQVSFSAPKLPLISNLTGQVASPEQLCQVTYWLEHILAPVQLVKSVERLHLLGCDVFVELGPKPLLLQHVRRHPLIEGAHGGAHEGATKREQTTSPRPLLVPLLVPLLRPGRTEVEALLDALGVLYVRGISLNWKVWDTVSEPPRLPLPTYPFQRILCALPPPSQAEAHAPAHAHAHSEAHAHAPAHAHAYAGEATTSNTPAGQDVLSENAAPDAWTFALRWQAEPSPRSEVALDLAPAAPNLWTERSAPALSHSSESWVVVGARSEGVNACLQALRHHGLPVVWLETAALANRFTTGGGEDLSHALAQALNPAPGVKLLYFADEVQTPAEAEQAALCFLRLAQRWAGAEWAGAEVSPAPRLWVITSGALAVHPGEGVPQPFGALLWGLGRSLQREFPALMGGLIDLDPQMPAEQRVQQLVRWMLSLPAGGSSRSLSGVRSSTGEQEWALRSGQFYVPRLVRQDHHASSQVPTVAAERLNRPLRNDGTWLITGGLGGLGLEVARWGASLGIQELLLIGRRSWQQLRTDAPHHEETLRVLRRQGVHVRYVRLDVTQPGALRTLLKAHTDSGGTPLRAVFHTAAVWNDQPILSLTPEGFSQVLAPKLLGAWQLHQETLGEDLDRFVLFSSASALLPPPGQANYAAANCFLDALAASRRAQGLPGESLAWGPWAEVGFASSGYGAEAQRRLEAVGIGAFSPAEGQRLLIKLVDEAPTYTLALKVDWATLKGADPMLAQRPLLSRLRVDAERAEAERVAQLPVEVVSPFWEQVLALPRLERPAFVVTRLQSVLGEALRMPPARLSPSRPLMELGIDSLIALELRNRVQRVLGLEIPLMEILRGSSLAELTEGLLTRLLFTRVLAQEPSVDMAASPIQDGEEELEL